MRYSMVVTLALASAVLTPAWAQSGNPASDASGVQLSRYTTVAPQPDASASDPLSVVATVGFPRSHVQSVGEAVRYLLARTGYQLIPDELLDERSRALLALPLPESHRQLGPYRVDAMLQVLLGAPWQLQVDRLARTVRFAPAEPVPQPTAAARL